VQVGALACFVFAGGLAVVWALLARALEGEVRPSPVELAELTARHRGLFMWTGIVWFAIHTIGIWVIIALFLVHADRQRPTLWVFTVLCSLSIFCWALFGAMSIPLGASTGPQYSDAMERANLSPEQHLLWTSKCRPDESVSTATGISVDTLADSCASAWDAPLLLMYEPAREQLTDAQRLHLQEAWSVVQDGWLLRKLSDTLYFSANGLFLLSAFFFAGCALTSRVIRTFSVTWGTFVGVLFALGFTAFWTDFGVKANLAAIAAQITLLVFIGIDIWGRKREYVFAQVRPDKRPVRLLRRDVPVEPEHVEWTYCLEDLWYRNRQITNTYARLAHQLGIVTHKLPSRGIGDCFPQEARYENGNWFHFGVWASNSAGARIWRSDLSTGTNGSLERTFKEVLQFGANKQRLSEALALGNRTVFGHVALMGQAFIAHFHDEPAGNQASWDAFVATVSAWTEPWQPDREARRALLPAFEAYYQARFARTPEERSEHIFWANLVIVSYEQGILQDVIADAAGNGLRLFLVFVYPSSLLRAVAWTAVFVTAPAAPLVNGMRRKRSQPLSKRGRAWEEWTLRLTARLLLGSLREIFGPEINRVVASQVVLTIGSRPPRDVIVAGQPLRLASAGEPVPMPPAPADGSPDRWLPWTYLRAEAEEVRVQDYCVLDDRLPFIARIFQRWQRSPALREEPFGDKQREEERMVLVSRIDSNFDSGLEVPVYTWFEQPIAPVASLR
jgi:hypothetical protein